MTVTAVDNTTTASIYSTTPTRVPKQTMDSEVFMQLLVTQLRAQDPSSPMDTNQMINQTTQLASMEKLTSLEGTTTENFSLQMRIAAAGLVGKEISYTGADGTAKTGIATGVSFTGSVPTLSIGTDSVLLDAVSGISTPTTTTN
jgi:flagellar basal-body rod modification protein FlgD